MFFNGLDLINFISPTGGSQHEKTLTKAKAKQQINRISINSSQRSGVNTKN